MYNTDKRFEGTSFASGIVNSKIQIYSNWLASSMYVIRIVSFRNSCISLNKVFQWQP